MYGDNDYRKVKRFTVERSILINEIEHDMNRYHAISANGDENSKETYIAHGKYLALREVLMKLINRF